MARRRCIGPSIATTSPRRSAAQSRRQREGRQRVRRDAAVAGRRERQRRLSSQRLLDAGADANERLLNTDTVLMMAARTGNVATMKVLLDRGADVNAKETARGTTALMWAAAQKHPAAVQLLVDRGADVSAVTTPPGRIGPSATPRPSIRDRRGSGTAATRAARSVRGTRAIERAEGSRRWSFAVRGNDPESVRILLAAGADVNQVTNYGWSPLLVATQNRYYQLASFLLDHGANPNLANKGAWSPLYIAVDNRNIEGGDYPLRKPDMDHLDFIKKLIDKGADVNHRDQRIDVVPHGVHVAVGP